MIDIHPSFVYYTEGIRDKSIGRWQDSGDRINYNDIRRRPGKRGQPGVSALDMVGAYAPTYPVSIDFNLYL